MSTIIRTPFVEMPNGDLVCSVTIPYAMRDQAILGHPVSFPLLPGDAAPAAPKLNDDYVVAIAPPTRSMPAEIDSEPSATDDEKPAPQMIGVKGVDTAEILGASFISSWKHDAAPHVRMIFTFPTFQTYALKQRSADPFAAPMPVAVSIIRDAAMLEPDQPLKGLELMFDDYIAWCKAQGLAPWPVPEQK